MLTHLNADVGEGLASDLELYPCLNQASIACGGHAGDGDTMRAAVDACLQYKVTIGAHPSYPDRENFGRKTMNLQSALLIDLLQQQIHNLEQICQTSKARIGYVKPHGALYNDMMAKPQVYRSVLQAVASYPSKLALMIGALPAALQYAAIAGQAGVTLIKEAFADRLYLDNGQLCPRSERGAVYCDQGAIIEQVTGLLEFGTVTTQSGKTLVVDAATLCIHGDNPASVLAAKTISRKLAE